MAMWINDQAQIVKNQIVNAQKELKANPDVINEIIEERRDANKKICNNAVSVLRTRGETLQTYEQGFIDAAEINGNFDKERQLIKQILAEHTKIEGFILATEGNLSKHVSLRSDKTIDKEKNKDSDKNRFMSTIHDLPTNNILIGGETIKAGDEEQDKWTYKLFPSQEQLKEELKRTKQTTKIWQGLSKIQGDDDRSKGYAALSDNLASMAMTGINTGRQGIALMQALLKYAVVDVLYHGLLEGAGKGLVKGAGTGYEGTNKGIKAAANGMYQIKKGADKQLKQQIATQIVNIKESLESTYSIETTSADELRNALDEVSKIKDVSERAEKFKEAIGTFNQGKEESQKLYLDNIVEVNRTVSTRNDIINSNSNRATKGAAALGGLAGGLVVSICNTIWEGIKNPALAVWDIKDKVQNRYDAIKPNEGESWNKDRATVKKEREIKKVAKSQIGYAKKTDKEGKFAQMVKEQKKAAKKAKGEGAKSI